MPKDLTDAVDSKNLESSLQTICDVSPFLDPQEYYPYSLEGKLGDYLRVSQSRFDVVREHFSEHGLSATTHTFPCYTHEGQNGIFHSPKNGEQSIWFVGHHDYCAGEGAEDDATALAVMLEIARLTRGTRMVKYIVFGSFDLEEQGLIGARKFVESLSQDSRKKIQYVIDLECLGSGRDMAICSNPRHPSDGELCEKLTQAAASLDYPSIQVTTDLSHADHLPFIAHGIKGTQLCSLDYDQYCKRRGSINHPRDIGLVNHSKDDLRQNIRIENLIQTTHTLVRFLQQELD